MKKIISLLFLFAVTIFLRAEEPGDDKRLIFSKPFAQSEGEYVLYGKNSDIYKFIKRLESVKLRNFDESIDLGYAYFIIKEKDKAVKEFQSVIDSGELNPKCFNMIGGIYLEKGNNAKAEEYYLKTLEKYPNNLTALYNTAHIYYINGEDDKAKRNIRKILDNDKEYYDAHELLGLIAQKENKPEEAEKYFRKEIELYSSSPESHRRLADLIAQRGGDINEIIHHYRAALSNSPYDNEVRKLLISAYEKKGGESLDIAKDEKKLLSLKPQNSVLYNYSLTFIRKDSTKEDMEKAIEILKEQLKRYPGYPAANLNIGVLYVRMGDRKKAFDYYLKELDVNINNVSVYYNIGYYFLDELKQAKTRKEAVSNLACAKGMFHRCTIIDPFDKKAEEIEARIDKYLSEI